MTANIIYFTAGFAPTTEEAADIAALNAFCTGFSLTVSNGSVPPNLGSNALGAPLLDNASYAAGTVPSLYSEVPLIDPDNPFDVAVGADSVVITDADVLTIGEETFTFTIEDGAVTAIVVGAVE